MLDEDCKLGNFSTTHLCWAPAPGCKPGAARPQQAVRSMQHSMLRQVWCSKHLGDLVKVHSCKVVLESLNGSRMTIHSTDCLAEADADPLSGGDVAVRRWHLPACIQNKNANPVLYELEQR